MSARYAVGRMLACAFGVCVALNGCESGDRSSADSGPPRDPTAFAGPGLRSVSWMYGYLPADVASCEEQLRAYARGSACEKLALAEYLLVFMTADEKCEAVGYEWKPGTDDLSRPAGRAKWALELLLRVKLPGTVDGNASPEYLRKLREAAHLAVEAYRQGIIASAADNGLSPEEFARLKRKYNGKIVRGPWENGSGDGWEQAMDALLLEWPPIGRKYEDLVSITGAKGRSEEHGVSYTFYADPNPRVSYRFIVRDGVIRSARKGTF